MTIATTPLRAFAFSTIIFVLPAGTASAQDATTAAERLRALVFKQGMEMSWENATGDPSRIVLEGVALKPLGLAATSPIGDVVLSDVSERDGIFRVGSMTTSAFSLQLPGTRLEVGPATFNGLSLPPPDSGDPMASFMIYDDAVLESLSVDKGGRNAFTMRNGFSRMTSTEGGAPMEFSGGVQEFSTDLSLVDDPQLKAYLQALGYRRLDGGIEARGSWQPADGRLSLTQYDIAIDDVGTLSMTLDLGGMTPELLEKANQLSIQINTMDDEAGHIGQQMALLGMFSSATLRGASLRFSDDSLTSRAINMVATAQGADPADVANMARGAVPLALMQMQLGELAGMVAPAINTFLDNPDNIQIVARPSRPVTFAEIGSAAIATPHDQAATARALVDLLGVSVSANQ